MLKKYEREIIAKDWIQVRDGLEVKTCVDPQGESKETFIAETFILVRSADRAKKEQAMHEKFERRIEEGVAK